MNAAITSSIRSVRPAAQAGRFYDADPRTLRQTVTALLAASPKSGFCSPPLALLAPHAGYVYSGAAAAAAFRVIQNQTFDRIMILAPNHTTPFTGAALSPHAAFETPLGQIPVDQAANGELSDQPRFVPSGEAHAQEHAIEVQLPFLQVTLTGPFQILPIILGETPRDGLRPIAGQMFELVRRRREQGQRWLIIASSDTYHGYDRQACQDNDRRLTALIESMNADHLAADAQSGRVMACGWKGLAVTMMLAEQLGARECRILDRRDSSQARSAGGAEPGRYVVGYVSAAFQ